VVPGAPPGAPLEAGAERIEVREYLSVTASFDHDIVDGAPAARFARRLRELVEGAELLRDLAG